MAENNKNELSVEQLREEFEKKNAELEEKLAQLDKLSEEYKEKLEAMSEHQGDTETSTVSNGPLRDISRHKDDDYVEVRLYKDGARYKDDVFVGINGTMCQIKRGVPVKVKRAYARIIGASEDESAKVNSAMVAADGKMEKIGG